MPHPYRVRAAVVAQNSYGPTPAAPATRQHSGPSPLVEVRLVESGLSASTPAAPLSRNPRLAAALRAPVVGTAPPLYSRDFLTASPTSFGPLPADATFAAWGTRRTEERTETSSGWEYAETFRVEAAVSGYRDPPDQVTAPGVVYPLSALPLGAEAWFQFANDPVTGSPFASPRWYLGSVEGTPEGVRLRPRGAPAPAEFSASALYTEVTPAVLEWFGDSLSELPPIGTPALGAPATFRGPDGIPVNGYSTVAELGALPLAVAPGKVIAVAPAGAPVTNPWKVIKL